MRESVKMGETVWKREEEEGERMTVDKRGWRQRA